MRPQLSWTEEKVFIVIGGREIECRDYDDARSKFRRLPKWADAYIEKRQISKDSAT